MQLLGSLVVHFPGSSLDGSPQMEIVLNELLQLLLFSVHLIPSILVIRIALDEVLLNDLHVGLDDSLGPFEEVFIVGVLGDDAQGDVIEFLLLLDDFPDDDFSPDTIRLGLAGLWVVSRLALLFELVFLFLGLHPHLLLSVLLFDSVVLHHDLLDLVQMDH